MEVLKTADSARRWRASAAEAPALVPTMGALHAAHRSLMRRAAAENPLYAVSIFVNPAQFGPGEDYLSYPRSQEEDIEICREEGASAVFIPAPGEMYPEGFSTRVNIDSLTETMCGALRPGHFSGVATVVAKLFNLLSPGKAYFGEKDFQQLRVVQQMSRDLDFGVEVVPCPTLREDDGLAVSSRNRYLSPGERSRAGWIYRALEMAGEMVLEGERDGKAISRELKDLIEKEIPEAEVEYAGVYDPVTLKELGSVRIPALAAAAVRLGKARLIDNILINDDKKKD